MPRQQKSEPETVQLIGIAECLELIALEMPGVEKELNDYDTFLHFHYKEIQSVEEQFEKFLRKSCVYYGLPILKNWILLNKIKPWGKYTNTELMKSDRASAFLEPILQSDWQPWSIDKSSLELRPFLNMEGEKFVDLRFELEKVLKLIERENANSVGMRLFDTKKEVSVEQYRTGMPGRPSIKHLLIPEMTRRFEAGDWSPVLAQEARELREWAAENHSSAPTPTKKSVENAIRDDHRKLKNRMPRK